MYRGACARYNNMNLHFKAKYSNAKCIARFGRFDFLKSNNNFQNTIKSAQQRQN